MSNNYLIDQLIRLKGLKNEAYNGKLARVDFFSSTTEVCHNGRYRVKLLDEEISPLQSFIDVKPENMEHACKRCHKGGENLLFCGKCRHSRYCDSECQRIDWETHKKECKLFGLSRDTSKNPLIIAIAREDLGRVRKLVQEGADVDMTSNTTNVTALHYAATGGFFPICQYLLQHGADKEKTANNGSTPLYMAAQYGHLPVVQVLVEQGADKDKVNNEGASPLFIAAEKGYLPVVQFLVEQGADKDKANNSGTSPLFLAVQNAHLPVVQFLVEQGADINEASNSGTNSLFLAAQNGHLPVVKYLLEQGIDLNKVRNDGSSPLFIAVQQGHLPVVQCLVG